LIVDKYHDNKDKNQHIERIIEKTIDDSPFLFCLGKAPKIIPRRFPLAAKYV